MEPIIKSLHTSSFKGIWILLRRRKVYKSKAFLVAILVSIALMVFYLRHQDGSYEGLKELSDLVMVAFPCLLGFTLAGFAVIVAFPNLELIEENSKEDGISLYQALGVFFSLCVILQTMATALGFGFSWLIKVDMSAYTPGLHNDIRNGANIIAIFALSFVSIYSICLMPYIALNLFSLLQVNSLFFTLKKRKRGPKSKGEDDESTTH